MERKRSLGKTVALGCGGLILLAIVVGFAGYGILRAVGSAQTKSALARLKASGAPTTWEEVIPPPIPDDQNAAALYERAFAAMASGTQWGVLRAYADGSDPQEQSRIKAQVAQGLAANADALRYAAAAAKRPRCRFDRNWNDPTADHYGRDWIAGRYFVRPLGSWRPSDHLEASRPDLYNLQNLATLANAQAVFLANQGHRDAALEAWSINAAILVHLGSDPTLFGQFARCTLAEGSARPLQQVLECCRPSEAECRRVGGALTQLNFHKALEKALQAELIVGMRQLEDAGRDWRLAGQLVPSDRDARARTTGRVAHVKQAAVGLGYRFVSGLDKAALVQAWRAESAVARKPYRETVGRSANPRDFGGYAMVTRRLCGVPEDCTLARDTVLATVGLMRTALGLAAYRDRFGRYPRSLDDLRSRLGWQVPEDPFSGNDFSYFRMPSGYLLYSVGQDLDDDFGKPGDIVWRVAR